MISSDSRAAREDKRFVDRHKHFHRNQSQVIQYERRYKYKAGNVG